VSRFSRDEGQRAGDQEELERKSAAKEEAREAVQVSPKVQACFSDVYYDARKGIVDGT